MYPNSLDLKRKFQPDDYADTNLRTVFRREAIAVRQPRIPSSCDSRYMPSLLVFKKNKPCLELEAANIDPNNLKIQDKIVAALKCLTFREQRVLVQFWWLHEVGKDQLLTTIDQPFGIGATDAGLHSYRKDSEPKSISVDNDREKEDRCPAARVLRRGLPEWTSDLNNYTPKHFPQLECAISCKFHGCLSLPVFDLNTRLCVGVLELLTSSKYMSYAFEVQQIQMALKTENLSTQGFDFPALYVPNHLDEIHGILQMVCDIHNLPLAQTWAVSQHSSFVAHEKVIEKSCNSFDTRCVGKVCMSTAGLPFYVKDSAMWSFREACRVRHLDTSCGYVGKALLTRGSCFCRDVTKLSAEEYPLVHNARMNRLTSCFAICLRSFEANDDYVLEFFLPPDIKDSRHVLNLVQTLKQNILIGSGFELGDNLLEPSDCVADNFTPSDSESSISNLLSPTNLSMEETCATGTEAGEKGKKRKLEFTGIVAAEVSFNDDMKIFNFSISSGLSYLKNEVSQGFKLKGKTFRLKYTDKEDDLILITCDVDLKLAVETTGINNSINLTCLLD